MEREQFTFYASFAKAIQKIRKASDRALAYDAIVNYALKGTLPDLDKLPDSVCIVFELTKPNLDASRRKAQGGKSGSKSKDEEELPVSSEEDTDKIPERSEEDTGNKKKKEDKKEDKKEKENECSISPLTPQRREELIQEALKDHGEDLIIQVRSWVLYKIEKRQPYKETGFKSMLTQIEKGAAEYGDAAMISVIQESMSSNYQGIMFDRLGRSRKPQSKNVKAECKPSAPISQDELWNRINQI